MSREKVWKQSKPPVTEKTLEFFAPKGLDHVGIRKLPSPQDVQNALCTDILTTGESWFLPRRIFKEIFCNATTPFWAPCSGSCRICDLDSVQRMERPCKRFIYALQGRI